MENIIKKAKRGGWEPEEYREHRSFNVNRNAWNRTTSASIGVHEIVCDPLFWQALGKACGWNTGGKIKTITAYKHFFQRNWQKGWNHAVEYLENLITNPSQEAEK